ncbi:FkbM family methyltransferase [Ancylobacter sp. G4_0304]|uniref:FkbM family methyltransferase n=1 Tax=Ancylobacter sp. G4_0304 TaxID=3114289 RepID=UPI0039C7281C
MISYAQNFEDVMIARLFPEDYRGTYIDLGAADPLYVSVTKHFYDAGWRGINIEPLPRFFRRLEAGRPEDINLQALVGDETGVATFYEIVDYPENSTMDKNVADMLAAQGHVVREQTVDIVTLRDVCERHVGERQIDFLKIDVEGAELAVLKSADWTRFRPVLVVIEAVVVNGTEPTWQEWEYVLVENGYEKVWFDGLNNFYLRKESLDLRKHFVLPPGAFDNFKVANFVPRGWDEGPVFGVIEEVIDELNVDRRGKQDAIEGLLEQMREAGETITRQQQEVERLSGRLAAIEKEHLDGQAAVRKMSRDLAASMTRTHDAVRKAEREFDDRRWGCRLPRAIAAVKKYGEWLFQGILCQEFPLLPAKPRPRISIVTPVFNNADTIRETIESVLNQKNVELEYIIVDGGSTDGSVEIIREYADRLTHFIHEPDHGMYDAIAKGFIYATGDIFAYINADDVYENGALSRAVDAFSRYPSYQVVYFEDSVTVNGWRFPNIKQKYVDFYRLYRRHILFQDGVFFTRRAYNYVGGLNRGLRAAGDWDLWVRLAFHFPFKKLTGNVSSFRVRPGQLSQNMDVYYAEMDERRRALRREIPRIEWWLRYPRYVFNNARNKIRRFIERFNKDRQLFFPIPFKELPPPPGLAPAHFPQAPVSPIDQLPPSALLFSTRDTRFGDKLISYVYYHKEEDVVSYYPPLSREELKDLYARNYNNPNPEISYPEEGYGSPYRKFRARRSTLRKLARAKLSKRTREYAIRKGLLTWPDQSLEEINIMLKAARPGTGTGARLSFLDVGCFDGKLLDRLAELNTWDTCGLEPNADAAEIARGKGHRVWTAEVEDALTLVPPEVRFDVIFLGQTIEHFNDPLAAIQQLSSLLAENGVIILSTPNLDSIQIEMFGPTWSHWHAPYHRHLFSAKSLGLLADRAGMKMVKHRTWSHPGWSWLSIKMHEIGLGGFVPHGVVVPPDDIRRAESLAIICRVLFDWRGRGDYIYAAFKKKID